MYPTTLSYSTAIQSNARACTIRGVVGNHSFDAGDVLLDSYSYTNQLCPATEVTLGGVYIGKLALTFTSPYADSLSIRNSWRGLTISIEEGIELADSTFEYIPINTFTVSEATWSDKGLAIVAYDNMTKFDKAVPFDTTTGSIYDILSLACLDCGVVLGMSSADCAALTNGSETFGLYPDGTVSTYRDLISQLATASGCFATINRSGALVFRQLPKEEDVSGTVRATQRYSTSFSDYSTFYSGIEVTDVFDEAPHYYTNDTENGLTMSIGSNPFLQYGLAEIKERMRQAIADELEGFVATPFDISILPNPAIDLGDLLTFPGGFGLGCSGCVMNLTHSIKKTRLVGYGKNPTASDVLSNTDKALNGLRNKTSENEVVIHTFVNAQEITLGEDELKSVAKIKFTTINPKKVIIHHEIDLDCEATSEDGIITAQAFYYVNGVLETYSPVTTWNNDGMHLLPLMYFLETLLSGSAYTWEVKLKITGGTATIDRGSVRAYLEGQGLLAINAFDGNIEIADEYSPFEAGFDIVALSDSISLDTQRPQTISLSDSVTAFVAGFDIVGLSDSVRLRTAYVQFNIVSEDDDFNIISEDGQFNIVSEGGYD